MTYISLLCIEPFRGSMPSEPEKHIKQVLQAIIIAQAHGCEHGAVPCEDAVPDGVLLARPQRQQQVLQALRVA